MRLTKLTTLFPIMALTAATASAQTATPATPTVAATNADNTSVARTVNDRLPSWVRFGGEYRLRFEDATGLRGVDGADDAYALSRLRLNLTFLAGSHVRFFVEGQDARAGGYAPNPDPANVRDEFDLRQAYVEVRQAEKSGWAVRLGRQELSYDDQRVVGASNWTNTARVFDAAKVSYSDARFAVDAFASSVVVSTPDHFDRHLDGQNFYGVHASFLNVIPNAELVSYAYWKTNPFVLDEHARPGDADTVTFGARAAGKVAGSFDYAVDLIGQRGSYAGDDIRAGAAHAQAGYLLSKRAPSPKLRVEYSFATGDASPGDGVRGTYDQLYPTNHAKYGLIDQVGLRNIHDARAGLTLKPTSRLTVDVDYNSFWLAHRRDGLYDASGALVARVLSGAAGSHVAQEADVQATYAVSPSVSLGAGYGHWFPGEFWTAATPGTRRNFVYSFASYRF